MKNNGLYGSIEIPPTKLDNELTSGLIEYQHKFNLLESEQDRQKKIMVLKFLKDIVKNWVRELIIKKGMSENLSKDIKIKICTFGSYKLGVSSKTSDIDTILITPIHVDREDFFEGLYPKLKECERVSKIQPIKAAFVPLMNFELDGVEIDLIFARLSMNNISKDIDLTDINILKNLDRSNVRSLNGYRDTCSMLDYVPNLPSFRTALVALKHWAKNRGLYSNSFGFFGGISWALLCAVICQIYPLSQPSTLLKKFFHLFSQWVWKNPVQLNKVVDHRFTDSQKGTPLDVWSPFEDGNHMPVITPCYPAMNSTHNVSYSTKTTIIEEFKRGEEIIINIEEKKDVWDTLFQPVTFFSNFPHFVCIHISSKNPEDLHSLKGWFESKIKMLTKILEDSPAILFVRPFPQCFKDENDVSSVYFYLGIKIQIKCLNLKEELEKNISFFYQKISFEKKEDNSLTMKTLKRKDLPKWLPRKYFSDVVPTRRKRSLPNSTQPTTQPNQPTTQTISQQTNTKTSEQIPENSPQVPQTVDQSPPVQTSPQSLSNDQIVFEKPVSSEMKPPEIVSVVSPSEDTQGNPKKLKLDTKENGKPVVTSMANHSPIVERLDSNIFAPKKKEEKVKPTFTISFN